MKFFPPLTSVSTPILEAVWQRAQDTRMCYSEHTGCLCVRVIFQAWNISPRYFKFLLKVYTGWSGFDPGDLPTVWF